MNNPFTVNGLIFPHPLIVICLDWGYPKAKCLDALKKAQLEIAACRAPGLCFNSALENSKLFELAVNKANHF